MSMIYPVVSDNKEVNKMMKTGLKDMEGGERKPQ